MNDSQLVAGLQRHDRCAWYTLQEHYLPTLWRFAYSKLDGDRDVAEEIVAETMLSLVRSIHSWDPKNSSLAGWLRTVATRRIQDHHRATARVRRLMDAAKRRQSEPVNGNGAHDSLVTGERQQAVRQVMDQLPEVQRMALEWKYVDRLSVDEIAARLGQTQKSVESMLYRGRQQFRKLFDQKQRIEEHPWVQK